MQTLVLESTNQRRNKRAPIDMVVKGFSLDGYVVDTNALSPLFTLRINHEDRLVQLPTAPFQRPLYFDMPMVISQGSLLELDIADPGVVLGTANPRIILEYEPLYVMQKGKKIRQKGGNTMMKLYRAGPAVPTLSFDLSPQKYCRVMNSFCFEDDNAVPAANVIAYPLNATTNMFTFKYQIDDTRNFRFIEEGQMAWWKWGFFRRSAAAIGAGPVNLLQEVQRRRYWPGIIVKPFMEFFMDRVIPVAGLTNATNIVFEYDYFTEQEFARMNAENNPK